MRFFVFDSEGMACALAWRLKLEGNEVRFFSLKPEGREHLLNMVEQPKSFLDGLNWVGKDGYVICGDETDCTPLRKRGYKVYGSNGFLKRIEDDRNYQHQIVKAAGIRVPNAHHVKSVDEAIAFIKAHPDAYCLKQMGDAPKTWNFVGKEDDGTDVIDQLQWMKGAEEYKRLKGNVPFMLQEVVDGLEFATSAWWQGDDWMRRDDGSILCEVNREHKKSGDGDTGLTCGEAGTVMCFTDNFKLFEATLEKLTDTLRQKADGVCLNIDANCGIIEETGEPFLFECFDEETECLTENGWKKHDAICIGEKVFSINPENFEMGWKPIVNKFVYEHDGEMIRFGSVKSHSALDALVTPEHRMLVLKRKSGFQFSRADSIPANSKIIRTGQWKGENPSNIKMPEYIENHCLSDRRGALLSKRIKIVHPSKFMSASTWMKFLGLFLAEGSYRKNGQIQVAQSSNSKRREEIEKILSDTGFKFTIQKEGNYQISSVQLTSFLTSLGLLNKKCFDKFVPRQFKEFSIPLLQDFLYGFYLGDGSIHHRTQQRYFSTTSPFLASDLQEMIHKCGWVANIRRMNTRGTVGINGTTRRNDSFHICERRTKTDYCIDKRVTQRIPYKGKVWDLEISEWHTLFVRRNGKAFFSGNCTPREGYPSQPLIIHLLAQDTGKFFADLIDGKQGVETKPHWGVVTVLGSGNYPQETTSDNHEGSFKDQSVIIPQWEKTIDDHIHPLYIQYDPKKDFFRVADHYEMILAVTHCEDDIADANRQCVEDMEKIVTRAPNYRHDIGEKFKGKELPLLRDLGFV